MNLSLSLYLEKIFPSISTPLTVRNEKKNKNTAAHTPVRFLQTLFYFILFYYYLVNNFLKHKKGFKTKQSSSFNVKFTGLHGNLIDPNQKIQEPSHVNQISPASSFN